MKSVEADETRRWSAMPLFGAVAAVLSFLALADARAAGPEVAAVAAIPLVDVDEVSSHAYLFRRMSDGIDLLVADSTTSASSVGAVDVVIAAASLDILKPEFRFITRFLTTGRVKNQTLYGDLVVVGDGDPTIDEVRLQMVADALWRQGVQSIGGKLVLDETYFRLTQAEPMEMPTEELVVNVHDTDGGAPSDDVVAPTPVETTVEKRLRAELGEARYQKATENALVFNDSVVDVLVQGAAEGVRIVLDPPLPTVRVVSVVKNAPFSSRVRAIPFFDVDEPLIFLAGAIAPSEHQRITVSFHEPIVGFAHGLFAALKSKGIRHRRGYSVGKAQDVRFPIAWDASPPLYELLRAFFSTGSDVNRVLVRNNLLRTLAVHTERGPGTPGLGLHAVNGFLVEKVRSREMFLTAQSVLEAPDAHLSLKHVVDVLQYMHGRYELSPEFTRALASDVDLLSTWRARAPKNPINVRAQYLTRRFIDDTAELYGYIHTDLHGWVAVAIRISDDEMTEEQLRTVLERGVSALGNIPAEKQQKKGGNLEP